MRTPAIVTFLIACAVITASQQLPAQSKAQEIAAAFNKHKGAVRAKYGVRKEKYKDVRSEPVVKQNIRDYSGVYEVSDLGYTIIVQVWSDGRVRANGYEKGQPSRTFELEHAKIEGALLTATKAYPDGAVEKFDGVFMTRTERNSPSDTGVVAFGLGVVLGTPVELGGITYDKLFYQLKQ